MSVQMKNTSWKFIDKLETLTAGTFNVTFGCGGLEYSSITVTETQIVYNTTTVYETNHWLNTKYQYMILLGGTDIASDSFIQFMNSWASQEPLYTIDINSFDQWKTIISNLSVGSHTLKIKSKKPTYIDSDYSESATFTVNSIEQEIASGCTADTNNPLKFVSGSAIILKYIANESYTFTGSTGAGNFELKNKDTSETIAISESWWQVNSDGTYVEIKIPSNYIKVNLALSISALSA